MIFTKGKITFQVKYFYYIDTEKKLQVKRISQCFPLFLLLVLCCKNILYYWLVMKWFSVNRFSFHSHWSFFSSPPFVLFPTNILPWKYIERIFTLYTSYIFAVSDFGQFGLSFLLVFFPLLLLLLPYRT